MAKNSQFSLNCLGRGSQAVATELAIIKRDVAAAGIAKTRVTITKRSIKAITIR